MLGSPRPCRLVSAVTLILAAVTAVHSKDHYAGTVILQGCTEAFISMVCPQDDYIYVRDVRYEMVDTGHPCHQELPPENITIPQELTHVCIDKDHPLDGNTCVYVEEICDGWTGCTFYVSPHLIAGKEQPTHNSEVFVEYECHPGYTRTGGIVVAALLATISILSLTLIGGLLLKRTWFPPASDGTTSYGNFSNESATSGNMSFNNPTAQIGSPSSTPNPAVTGATVTVTDSETINVQLQTPPAPSIEDSTTGY